MSKMRLPGGVDKFDSNNPEHRAWRARQIARDTRIRGASRTPHRITIGRGESEPKYDVNARHDTEEVWDDPVFDEEGKQIGTLEDFSNAFFDEPITHETE